MRVTETITYDFGPRPNGTASSAISRHLPVRRPAQPGLSDRRGRRHHGRPRRYRWIGPPRTGGELEDRRPRPHLTGRAHVCHRVHRAGRAQPLRRPRGAVLERRRHRVGRADRPGRGQPSSGPAPCTRVGCFSGPEGSQLGCGQSALLSTARRVQPTNIGNGAAMTAVVAFPVGSVSNAGRSWSTGATSAAFHVSRATVGAAFGLALLGVAVALMLAWRHGRDRRYVGLLPGLHPGAGGVGGAGTQAIDGRSTGVGRVRPARQAPARPGRHARSTRRPTWST